LAIYWPALFISSHIPIPLKVREAGVSDKVLHLLAYLVLVFLFWIVMNPGRKVSWRRISVWAMLLIMLAYGIIDEVLQGFVGRSCDARDLAADMLGVLTGLILLTFFTARFAAVIVCGVTIFGLTNVASVKPADFVPVANALFHLISYAILTLLWLRCIKPFDSLKSSRFRWLAAAVALPTVVLSVTKVYSIVAGKGFPFQDIVLSVGGIAVVVGCVSVPAMLRRPAVQEPPGLDD
jgi:VanZ family protein